MVAKMLAIYAFDRCLIHTIVTFSSKIHTLTATRPSGCQSVSAGYLTRTVWRRSIAQRLSPIWRVKEEATLAVPEWHLLLVAQEVSLSQDQVAKGFPGCTRKTLLSHRTERPVRRLDAV